MANILRWLVYAYREDVLHYNTRFREAPVWRWFCLELCAASGMMESRGLAVRQYYIVHMCWCVHEWVCVCFVCVCEPKMTRRRGLFSWMAVRQGGINLCACVRSPCRFKVGRFRSRRHYWIAVNGSGGDEKCTKHPSHDVSVYIPTYLYIFICVYNIILY